MASEDDHRSTPVNNFLTPSHLHAMERQQQQQHRMSHLHEPPVISPNYTDRASLALTPYYSSYETRTTIEPHHHQSVRSLLVPPTRRIPNRRTSPSSIGSFANNDLFQDVAQRERQLDAALQEIHPRPIHQPSYQPLTIPNGTPDDVEGGHVGTESLPTITPPPHSWNHPPDLQTVASHHSRDASWMDDAITLFPTPSVENSASVSPPPNVPFSYDLSTERDRQASWSSGCPTSMPIRVYYHCKGHRYRTESRSTLQTVWRLEVREGYNGALQEWEFAITPGYYDFECCDNPFVLIGKHRNRVHMFVYHLAHQSQFRQQGLFLPIGETSNPTPCYLDATPCRGHRIGGFLHPYMYGVPGDHDDIFRGSTREFYLPMDVFASEGVIACKSWAAAKSRAIVSSYFGSRGGTYNVTPFDDLRNLLQRASHRPPFECSKPALVPYLEQQLLVLNLLDPSDCGGSFSRPTTCYGKRVGEMTPLLFTYDHIRRQSHLWDGRQVGVPSTGNCNASWMQTDPRPPTIGNFEDGQDDRSLKSIITHGSGDIPVREVVAKSPAEVGSLRSSTSSEEERRRSERRNERMKDVPELPPDSLGARKWAEGLQWRLMTDDWNQDGIHAVDITETTPANSRLSSDFLALILNSAMKHKTVNLQEAVQSKLSEIVEGPNGDIVDGRALLKSGKGFEIFQLRVGGSPVNVNVAFPLHDGVYTDANWGPQDASHPKEGEVITIEDAQSLLGHVVMRMGGPLCWGCIRETDSMSQSSCESEIYAANEGTKSVLTIRNLLDDFDYEEATEASILYNDNRGTVDWTKGCSVSRKLRHVNIRELSVRLHQRLGNVDVQHIAGKRNIADILTKEEKDDNHFRAMAFSITTPRLVANWNPDTGDTIADDGSIERPTPKTVTSPNPVLPDNTILLNTVTASAARGVLESACDAQYSINGWLSGYDPRAGLCAGMA